MTRSEQREPYALTREQCRNWLVLGAAVGGFAACRLMLALAYLPLGALLLVLLRRRQSKRRRSWFALGAAIAVLWVGLYCLLWYAPAASLWGTEQTFQGEVTDYPRRGEWSWTVDVRLRPESHGRSIPVRMYTTQNCAGLKPGDHISLTTTLRNPGERIPERFHSSASWGVFAQTKTVKCFRWTPTNRIPLKYWPKRVHHALRAYILKETRPEEAGLLLALLTGDQDELKEPLATELSRSGLRHIAAVSGLHVGVLTALMLRLPVERRARQLLAALALLTFCLVTGARPPVVRATVMGLGFLLGPFFRRDGDSWAGLRLSLVLLMLHNPFCLESVSMQLSFASVVGILRFSKPLQEHWMGEQAKEQHPWLSRRRGLWVSLSLSLGALVLTAPLMAWYFDTISLFSPLSNLLTLWAVELFFVGGALCTALGMMGVPVGVLWVPLHGLFGYIHWMATFFAHVPLGAVSAHVSWYLLWLAAVYGVLFLLWRRKSLRKRWKWFIPVLAALFLFCVMLYRSSLIGGGLAVQAVNVGQGQSILLFSEQEAAAVDCGGENAGNALADAMNDAVEGKLDYLILTHFDRDHINGLEQLLLRTEVTEILIPDLRDEEGGREQVEQLAQQYGVSLRTVTENSTLALGEATLTVFAPVEAGEDNDSGLSVLAQKGAFSVLVTGDMSQAAEEALLEREALQPVTVLVAGHHGSRTSTGEALLEQLHPERALISCGAGNRYGHPHEQTLERLKAAGCTAERTDLDGTLTAAAPIEK